MMLQFRYYLMQRAKVASTVGILVGTLATGNDVIKVSFKHHTVIPHQLVIEG